MKRAVKLTSTALTSVDCQPDRKLQPGQHQPVDKCSLVNVDLENSSGWLIWLRFLPYHRSGKMSLTSTAALFIVNVDREKCSGRHQLRIELSGWWSTSTAAFFLVDSRQPFSSRPDMESENTIYQRSISLLTILKSYSAKKHRKFFLFFFW